MILPMMEGFQIPQITRVSTGLWSLDRALGDQMTGQTGMPLRCMTEIYGREHSGKSSLAYHLAGMVRPEGRVILMDTEGYPDPNYLQRVLADTGFKGKIHVIDAAKESKKKREARLHTEMATELADFLIDDETNAVIMDSLGMYMSEAEKEGKIGDANMGRRARDITQWSRRAASHLMVHNDPPKLGIMVNHILANLSSRGHYTPGGRGKSHASTFRLYMWRKDNKFDYGAFQAEVKTEKLRWGGTSSEHAGIVFIIPGVGISRGFTALLDCVRLGIATRGSVVKIGDQSQGRIGTLLKAARDRNDKKFEPFYKALEGYNGGDTDTTTTV
jgi:RecA/RadA recombinase